MKRKIRHLALSLVTLFLVAPAAYAGSVSGGSSFAWDSILTRLRDNFVTTIAGSAAVIFLVGAVLSHRGGDSEATGKRLLGALIFGGIAIGAKVIVQDVASSFGAVLP